MDAERPPRRDRRRHRKVAAAAGAMLLVPAFVAGEPVSWSNVALANAGDIGRGLHGLTDPDSVGADGSPSEADEIGSDVLRNAGNPDQLANGPGVTLPTGPLGIPGVMLEAYMRAGKTMSSLQPTCKLHWSLLASIGRIESNHARGGRVDAAGNTQPQILGPVLNGGGFAAISDTDNGLLDGDSRWDRAVGPMQFIPSTWRGYVSDGNADGTSSPHNIYDASVAAGRYLCSGGLDMSNPQHRATAVFRYNHSDSYVRTVLIWADAYAKGVQPLPATPVPPVQAAALPAPPAQSPGTGTPTRPPASTSTRPPTTTTRTTGSSIPSSSPTSSTSSSSPTSTTTTTTSTTTTTTCVPPTTTTSTAAESEETSTSGAAGSSVMPSTDPDTPASTTTTPSPSC